MICEEDGVFSKILGIHRRWKMYLPSSSIIIGSLMVILERSVGVVSLKALNGSKP